MYFIVCTLINIIDANLLEYIEQKPQDFMV